MQIAIEHIADGIKKIVLAGKPDVEGAEKIDLQFSAAANGTNKILVDLANLESLPSIGIRTLILNAQAVNRRGGRMVAVNARPSVEKALRRSGTAHLIPMFDDTETALAALETR